MEKLNLDKLNLVELPFEQREKTDGGWFQAALAIAAAAIYVYNNAGDFADGFREGQAAY